MDHGRYRLIRRIGVGGMAEVFEAVMRGEAGFERRVAIKRMRGGDPDPAFARMFLDEARIASRLSHANVVAVLDYGVVDDRPFQVLELVDGIDASQLCDQLDEDGRTLPIELAVYICVELGHALACAHEAVDAAGDPLGIVHRDVTPHNVLMSWAGDVKLSDFGIAFAHDRIERTSAGVAKGKLAYMAPEQALGGRVDARTDVFALGCVLHALVTGASPLAEPDTLTGFLAGDPLPLDSDLPDDLRTIIARATARARSDRFGSAREITEALGAALAKRIDRDPKSMLAELLRPIRDARTRAPDEPVLDLELVPNPHMARSYHGAVRLRPAKHSWRRMVGLVVAGALAAASIAAGVFAWRAASHDAPPAMDAGRPAIAVGEPDAVARALAPDAVAREVPLDAAEVAVAPLDAGKRPPRTTPRDASPHAVEVKRLVAVGHLKIVGGEINHARVIIDRVVRGRAPTIAIELAAGRHQLTLELADGSSIGPFEIEVDERATAATPRVVRCTRGGCR